MVAISGGSCHKYHFCRDKTQTHKNTSFVATKVCLPRENFCRNKIMFVTTSIGVCRDKHTFDATKDFCCDKHMFVATKAILLAAPANDRLHGCQCLGFCARIC